MRFINLGMGRQSTALYLLSSVGEIPRADHAIFADTTHESKRTYDFINNHLLPWAKANNGIPIHIVRASAKSSRGSIMEAILDPTSGPKIPVYVKDGSGEMGMVRRTCTHVYKIMPIQAKIRELMGLNATGAFPPFEQWMGINVHEWTRMKQPTLAKCTFVYPFLGMKTSRGEPMYKTTPSDLFGGRPIKTKIGNREVVEPLGWKAAYPDEALPELYARFGLPQPPHSACVFCPFMDFGRWSEVRAVAEDWAVALQVDEALETVPQGLRGEAFLTRAGIRLRDMGEMPIIASLGLDTCEEGYCGV